MGIKRGVSLYSYQQSDWFGKMNWKAQLREVATNLGGATGIEIISEATVPQYPMPPERFVYEWNNEMARWGLKAVTMDCYLDVIQFRDHVMTPAETAERLKYDLRLAAKLGFENIRLVHNVPHESILMALPTAEEVGVRMTNEIHAPANIRPRKMQPGSAIATLGLDWNTRAAEDVALIQKTGTKFYGLQPDMGIFQYRPAKVQLGYIMREYVSKEESKAAVEAFYDIWDSDGSEAAMEYLRKNYKAVTEDMFFGMLSGGNSAEPEELFDIAPYIYCVHGKFYGMTEIKGKPGQYEEASIYYPEAIAILKAIGYDGYIDSEYEGQRSQQDMGDEDLPDEVEEVRRHHEMLKRLIGE